MNTNDYRNAPSNEGPQAAQWADKPHRLVYDLCNEVDNLNNLLDLERKNARDNYVQVLNKMRLLEGELQRARHELAQAAKPVEPAGPPTDAEALYLASFLNELSDRFGNDGCNDMYLPNTPENAAMVKAAQLHQFADDCHAFEDEAEASEVSVQSMGKGKPRKISTMNSVVLDYLQDRFMRQHGITRRNLVNTQDW
jgi:hypothetical protein